MKNYLLAFSLLLIAFFFLPTNLSATHYSTGEMYYKYIGDSTGVANEYQIFVNWYRDNPWRDFGAFQDICINSSCGPNIIASLTKTWATGANAAPNDTYGGWKLPDFDLCADTTYAAYISVHKYTGNVILPACAGYKITARGMSCCRASSDNLASSPDIFLEVDLNNTRGHNSSPQIISPAGRAFCLTQPGQHASIYPQTNREEDGDSLVYSLVNPQSVNITGGFYSMCDPGINIPYNTGFTANNPIPSYTGMSIDPNSGMLSFSPSQAGNYQIKVQIKEYRFDTISLQWLYIGNTVRDFNVPFTTGCRPQVTDGPKLKSIPSISILNNLLTREIDSIKALYGVSQIKGSDSLNTGVATITKLPFNYGYSCFDTVLSLTFNNQISYQSLDPTDIRLISSDGVPQPIVGIKNYHQITASNTIQLILHQPLDTDGNYLLQFKTGFDGNTLLNECGYALEEFYSAIVVVDSCPQASYQLEGVSVENNEHVRMQWSANNELHNANISQTFNAWIIHRRDLNDNQMKPIKVIRDRNARFFVDSFSTNSPTVSNNIYDYALLLSYNGKRREMTRNCATIKLNAAPTGAGLNKVFLSWNHYQCLDPNSRVYKIYHGSVDSITNNISWQQHGDMTSVNNFMINLNNLGPLAKGSYAYKVVAQNQKNNSAQDFAESNWVYLYHNPQMTTSGNSSAKLQVPNIITPNGDGVNDCFYIESPTDGEPFEKISLAVYKRNGELIYENKNFESINNSQSGWAGVNSSGQALASGVYYYVIEIRRKNSLRSEHFPGSLTISTIN